MKFQIVAGSPATIFISRNGWAFISTIIANFPELMALYLALIFCLFEHDLVAYKDPIGRTLY